MNDKELFEIYHNRNLSVINYKKFDQLSKEDQNKIFELILNNKNG